MSVTSISSQPVLAELTFIQEAILQTLAYSDVFDYPLTIDEIHKFLGVSATKEEVKSSVSKLNQVHCKDGFYFLANREEIVQIRKIREEKSNKVFKRASIYGKIIGMFPFVRMVGLTGSLAVKNLSQDADIDFMLITAPKRLWIARAFSVTFGRLIRLLGDKICVNLLVSENNLLWNEQDLYSAREICQMSPVSGSKAFIYFRVVNLWVNGFLPNAVEANNSLLDEQYNIFQKAFEILLLGKLGDKVEHWAMNFQMKIISRNEILSAETNFSPDICQGNFHQHKKWTMEIYNERLNRFSVT